LAIIRRKMKLITILLSGLMLLASCSNECTKYVKGEEREKKYILDQENIYPDCRDTTNFLHKALYHDGTLAHVVEIKNNNKDGIYKSYDINGNPERIGKYKNGKRYGLWKIWTDNSYLEKTYINDTLQGNTTEKHSDGNIVFGQYVNNKEQGLWKWFNKDSIIFQSGFYVDGMLNGEVKKFYLDGQLKSIDIYENDTFVLEKAFFDKKGRQILKNGTGLIYSYFDNGEIEYIGQYVESKRTGICKWFYKNGQLEQEALYNNNLRIEIIGSYDKNGKKRDAGTLKNGNGTWIKYDANGNIENIDNYKNGIKIE